MARPSRRLLAWLALSWLALLPTPLLAQGVSGTWHGTALDVYENGDTQTYRVILVIQDNGTGRTDYPTLGCEGVLSPHRQTGEFVEFRERIVRGGDTCLDGGIIAVRLIGRQLIFSWTGENTSIPGTTAVAVLRRQQ